METVENLMIGKETALLVVISKAFMKRLVYRCKTDGVTLQFFAFKDIRSEEHTSELQSRFDLVCRLLLEKKKIKKYMK